MAVIRYGIAGQPVDHSLSPLLTALVAAHLGLPSDEKRLKMELIDVPTMTDALAWGYAGAVPSQREWVYTGSVFGKFRTSALVKRAVEAAMEVEHPHPSLAPINTEPFLPSVVGSTGLPTRMFDEEIWINLTAPLKHQLDSSAVMCIDDSMKTKSVNALRWDGKGWWCAGLDGEGVREVLQHHGVGAHERVLGLAGGGGGARSTAASWVRAGGSVHPLQSRRDLEEGSWSASLTDDPPTAYVDFDGTVVLEDGEGVLLRATYSPMRGSYDSRIKQLSTPHLDGRWLLAAQHLACWRTLWAPELGDRLPTLDLLLSRLLMAESVLESYAT